MKYGVENFKYCFSIFSKTVKDRVMKFSGMIDLLIRVCSCGLSMPAVTSGRHQKGKNKSKFKKNNLSSQNLYHIIRSVFKCPKQLSNSGYFKNKFQTLNFQCLQSSLLLKCKRVTSGYEIWKWEIQKLPFHYLRNIERYSYEIFSYDTSLIGAADRGLSISVITSSRHRKWKKKLKFSKLIFKIKTYTPLVGLFSNVQNNWPSRKLKRQLPVISKRSFKFWIVNALNNLYY
jgi:hypothetical protein